MKRVTWLAKLMCLFSVLAFSWAGAEELQPGQFDGVTIKACLIGGGAYEKLYEEYFPKFEQLTGAKVEVVFKAQHFELDNKVKKIPYICMS